MGRQREWWKKRKEKSVKSRERQSIQLTTSITHCCPLTLQTDDESSLKPLTFFKILKWNAPEWKIMLVGCTGAAFYGTLPFFYGICMGGIFEVSRNNESFYCSCST